MKCFRLLVYGVCASALGVQLFGSDPTVAQIDATALQNSSTQELQTEVPEQDPYRVDLRLFKDRAALPVARLFARDCGLPQESTDSLHFERENEEERRSVRVYLTNTGEIEVQARAKTGVQPGGIFDVIQHGRDGHVEKSQRYFLKFSEGPYGKGSSSPALSSSADPREILAYQILNLFGHPQVDFLTFPEYPKGIIIATRNAVLEGFCGFSIDHASDTIRVNARMRWEKASTIQDLERLGKVFNVQKLADVAALVLCCGLWDIHCNNVLQIVPKDIYTKSQQMKEARQGLLEQLDDVGSDERESLRQQIGNFEEEMISFLYENSNYRIIDFLVGQRMDCRTCDCYSLSALLKGGYNDLLRDSTIVHQLSKSSFWKSSWWNWLWRRPAPVQRCVEECHRVFKDAGYPDDVISTNRKLLELYCENCRLSALAIQNKTNTEIADDKAKFLEENRKRPTDDMNCNIC